MRGTGDLRMEFQPAVPTGPDDPAIQFVETGARAIAFSAAEGDTHGRFGEPADTILQTGTTAGTLLLTARMGATTETLSLIIPAAAVGLDSVRATRTGTGVDVSISGFDNTRTASQIAFTFFDASSAPVGAGAIRVDAGGDFRRYFESTAAGGAFQVRASFPIAGNASQVSAVEVEVTNSAGVARSERIRF